MEGCRRVELGQHCGHPTDPKLPHAHADHHHATTGPPLLSPTDPALVLIDFQSQMAITTKSVEAIGLRNNAAPIPHAAAGFKVPTVLTTVAEKSFSGPLFSETWSARPAWPASTASA